MASFNKQEALDSLEKFAGCPHGLFDYHNSDIDDGVADGGVKYGQEACLVCNHPDQSGQRLLDAYEWNTPESDRPSFVFCSPATHYDAGVDSACRVCTLNKEVSTIPPTDIPIGTYITIPEQRTRAIDKLRQNIELADLLTDRDG